MRKLIWCCSAAGVLAAGSFLSLAYYACRCPDSMVGRSMQVVAEASLAMQPLSGLASMAMHANQTNTSEQAAVGSDEECIPNDPQPIAPEPNKEFIVSDIQLEPANEAPAEAAPIVIAEEEPMPCDPVPQPIPAAIEIPLMQGVANGCPIVMPYCQDDGEPPNTPPIMPHADGDDKPICVKEEKADDSSEDSEDQNFKEWMKLFEEAGKKDKSPAAEELPAPTEEEESQTEPKCQEDSHLQEHYPGCPRVTCPYSGKSYPVCEPPKQAGKEESSEEPPQHGKKPRHGKARKDKKECPCNPSVDTMEYRKSDGGLNEFGPGPLQ